jgi:hypothetical protein
LDEGAQLGVSSRGMGSLKEKDGMNVVQDDFYLATAADIVADPSAPNAFVEGIMEDRDWIYSNGAFKEEDLESAKKAIGKSGIKGREELVLQVFEHFFSKL